MPRSTTSFLKWKPRTAVDACPTNCLSTLSLNLLARMAGKVWEMPRCIVKSCGVSISFMPRVSDLLKNFNRFGACCGVFVKLPSAYDKTFFHLCVLIFLLFSTDIAVLLDLTLTVGNAFRTALHLVSVNFLAKQNSHTFIEISDSRPNQS